MLFWSFLGGQLHFWEMYYNSGSTKKNRKTENDAKISLNHPSAKQVKLSANSCSVFISTEHRSCNDLQKRHKLPYIHLANQKKLFPTQTSKKCNVVFSMNSWASSKSTRGPLAMNRNTNQCFQNALTQTHYDAGEWWHNLPQHTTFKYNPIKQPHKPLSFFFLKQI